MQSNQNISRKCDKNGIFWKLNRPEKDLFMGICQGERYETEWDFC